MLDIIHFWPHSPNAVPPRSVSVGEFVWNAQEIIGPLALKAYKCISNGSGGKVALNWLYFFHDIKFQFEIEHFADQTLR